MVLDRLKQFLSQDFFGRVLRQNEVVEACVSTGQSRIIQPLHHDDEVQLCESSQRSSVASSRELQQVFLLFFSEALHHIPEPHDCLVFCITVLVGGRLLQLCDVDLVDTADEFDDLTAVEQLGETQFYVDRLGGNDLVESLVERSELCLDRSVQEPVGIQSDELLFVFVGDGDGLSAVEELNNLFVPEVVVTGGECERHLLDFGSLQDVAESRVEVGFELLDVLCEANHLPRGLSAR